MLYIFQRIYIYVNNIKLACHTHHHHFGSEAHVVLPGHAQHVGQVEREVDDAPAGGRQVGAGEERADEEALHDGHHAEGAQEEEDHAGVAVGQQVAHLTHNTTERRESDQTSRESGVGSRCPSVLIIYIQVLYSVYIYKFIFFGM